MAELSKERIEEFKVLLEKEKGMEVSYAEAEEGAHNMAQLADILFDCYLEDKKRKKKLEESPKGFHLEGVGYTCFICGNSVSNEQAWYDKYGIKCLVCQKAIDEKIISATAAKYKDSWYSKYDLESRFNIDRHAMNRFVKQGILKPRVVLNSAGRPHVHIFLIKDNKDTLPPKKLTESKMVKETKDGKDWFHTEPWFRFVDPQVALKDYKIMNHLRVIKETEIPVKPKSLILITGIPGMGKTFVGDFLKVDHGYTHIDMEADNYKFINEVAENPEPFLEKITASDKVVVTWGFVPNDHLINIVNLFKTKGFKLIWLDGNRKAAFREFVARESKKGSEHLQAALAAWDAQLNRINTSDVVKKIQPIVINTFKSAEPDAKFKKKEELTETIIS